MVNAPRHLYAGAFWAKNSSLIMKIKNRIFTFAHKGEKYEVRSSAKADAMRIFKQWLKNPVETKLVTKKADKK